MKLRVLAVVTALTALGLVAPKSSSQTDLNSQLKEALCAQNWGRAIQVIDKMKVAAPESSSELTSYRERLAHFLKTGTAIPNWPQDCSVTSNSTTSSTSTTASNTNNSTIAR